MASIDSDPGIRIARQIAAKLGETLTAAEFLGEGSTSRAFRITSDKASHVLRVASPRAGKRSTYETDFAIRHALVDAGQPVARPVATDKSLPIEDGARWALDEFCPGDHPVRAAITTEVSAAVGELLRALHGQPVTGFGQFRDSRETLRGLADDPVAGMLSRLESPWPFCSDPLAAHPSVRKEPDLEAPLRAIEQELRDYVQTGSPVATHTDLHEGQLLIEDNRLCAVLDFNDAVASRKEWDFGSWLY